MGVGAGRGHRIGETFLEEMGAGLSLECLVGIGQVEKMEGDTNPNKKTSKGAPGWLSW